MHGGRVTVVGPEGQQVADVHDEGAVSRRHVDPRSSFVQHLKASDVVLGEDRQRAPVRMGAGTEVPVAGAVRAWGIVEEA